MVDHMATSMQIRAVWVFSVAGSLISFSVGLDGGFKTFTGSVKAQKVRHTVSCKDPG